jgi:hypothetical protein
MACVETDATVVDALSGIGALIAGTVALAHR